MVKIIIKHHHNQLAPQVELLNLTLYRQFLGRGDLLKDSLDLLCHCSEATPLIREFGDIELKDKTGR
jgi:hypothetical protein